MKDRCMHESTRMSAHTPYFAVLLTSSLSLLLSPLHVVLWLGVDLANPYAWMCTSIMHYMMLRQGHC